MGIAGLLALLGGILESIRLISENQIHSGPYLDLTLFLVSEVMTRSFWIAVITGSLLSLFFGFQKKSLEKPLTLIFQESALILLFIAMITSIKKYLPDLLRGSFAYWFFGLSHWVKGNALSLVIIFLFALLLGFFAQRFKRFHSLLSLKLIGLILLLLFWLKGISWAYDKSLQSQLRRKDAPNVILLTVDTLRADHLSGFGYELPTTPFLDSLAKESVVFQNAVPTWTKTNQSFAGILTGKYCFSTGIGDEVASILPRRNVTMAEALKNEGYRTAALVSNANLSRYFGFSDGFDEYVELWQKQKGPARERGWDTADQVTERGVRWLSKNHKKKFFLWVHYIDPHTPYTPPASYQNLFNSKAPADIPSEVPLEKMKPSTRLGNRRDLAFYVAQYDGEIRFTDDQIRLFVERVRELGLLDNTLLIFTADHGEGFGEHELYFDHGKFVYQTDAHVPLMIRYPKEIPGPRNVDSVVSLADLFPTVLDFLQIAPPLNISGQSLRSLLVSGKGDQSEPVFIESDTQLAVRTQDWKFIQTHAGERLFYELYDLKKDPFERTNLLGRGLPQEKELREKLENWLQRVRLAGQRRKFLQVGELDLRTQEQLRSLGYVQ